MKRFFAVFFALSLVAACSSAFLIPDPVPGGGHKTNPETSEPAAPAEEPEQKPGLVADGNDAETYALILSRGYTGGRPT